MTVFTGLVQDIGTIEAKDESGEGARLRIATRLGAEVAPGDSVAVNGVCLTATDGDPGSFSAEAMNQTLRVTSLGPLEVGDGVNLELAVRMSDRLAGHLTQGHVDTTAEVTEVAEDGFARRLRLRLDPESLRFVVERGSVSLDGVSLTVSAVGEDWLEVSLTPETLERTTLGAAAPGHVVNVELDVIAKYVERLVSPFARKEEER
ncbi:MAG TPA: riboflavin synthase [Solirubrobacterales bacterium]|nr:riboflavin synthase [Solirubrobacterales bacterium]